MILAYLIFFRFVSLAKHKLLWDSITSLQWRGLEIYASPPVYLYTAQPCWFKLVWVELNNVHRKSRNTLENTQPAIIHVVFISNTKADDGSVHSLRLATFLPLLLPHPWWCIGQFERTCAPASSSSLRGTAPQPGWSSHSPTVWRASHGMATLTAHGHAHKPQHLMLAVCYMSICLSVRSRFVILSALLQFGEP